MNRQGGALLVKHENIIETNFFLIIFKKKASTGGGFGGGGGNFSRVKQHGVGYFSNER